MGHNHYHPKTETAAYLSKAFTIGIVLNIVFVGVEFVAGIILGSVALISDAGHNLSDVISLALALLAFRLSRMEPTDRYTYGKKKSTVIVSLANACLLLVAIGIILYESIVKIIDPQPIEGGAIAWVAGVGIVINAFTAWLFLRHKDTDLNVKGAFLHMIADTLVSVGVVISGLIIKYTGLYILDPIIGIVIAIVIFFSTWGLLRDSLRLSMDGVPIGIDPDLIRNAINSFDPSIESIHHLHIWPLSTTENAMTVHIVLSSYENACHIKTGLKEQLISYNIQHATFEFELPGERDNEQECNCR